MKNKKNADTNRATVCAACIGRYTKCMYQLVPRKLMGLFIVLWALMKIVVLVGIVVAFLGRDFFQSEAEKDVGNMKTFTDVSRDMLEADYWIDEDSHAADVLLEKEEISQLNDAFLKTEETHMYDLEHSSTRVDGVSISTSLMKSVLKNAEELTSYYDSNGNIMTQEYVAELAAETRNPDAVQNQTCKFLICTTETDLKAYPTEKLLLQDPDDRNEDMNQLSSIRLGEPMVALSTSASGTYYYVRTSNCSGWVRTDQVAVCRNQEEWLSIWKISDEECLVVTGIEIRLADSNETPELSGIVLSMGASLRMVAETQIPENVQARGTYYNYVVYIPMRKEDGSCVLNMALIPYNADVSVGFLTFSKENMVRQMFKGLGNVYGWGGMLHSQDCSGLIRDVYRCFGLELPRNTSWQQEMPVKKYDLSHMSLAEKIQQLKKLPIGTLLFMDGHEMMYLGERQGEPYCISAAGTVMNTDRTGLLRLRCISVNGLSHTYRPDNTAWIDNLTTALVLWE